jgi:PAB-dependent poly(A)-specific ribonuclease subunit 2
VGHGLTKDFDTANIFVPQEQVRDTVELWRLPNQRKISLRFLAAYLLKAEIQDELHDSIEDAKTAYALYLLYERTLLTHGVDGIGVILRDLYIYGNQNNWTLGMERLH